MHKQHQSRTLFDNVYTRVYIVSTTCRPIRSASWNASLFQEMNANEMSVVRDRSLNINPVSVCLNITVGLQVVVYILADVAKTRVTSTMQSAALPAPYIN